MNDFNFNPVTGLLDTTIYPTDPGSESAARQQFMDLFNQVKTFINNEVKSEFLPCRAKATCSQQQNISNGVDTALWYDGEGFDYDLSIDLATSPTRITCQKSGTYICVGNIVWLASAAGVRDVYIHKNNNKVLGESKGAPASAGYTHQNVSGLDYFVAGDYIELKVNQTSGGLLGVLLTDLTFVRVGD